MSSFYIISILILELASCIQNMEAKLGNISSARKAEKEYQSPSNDTKMAEIVYNNGGFQQILESVFVSDNSSEIYSIPCVSNWESSQIENFGGNLTGNTCKNRSDVYSGNGNILKPIFPGHYSTLFAAVAATLSAIIFFFGLLGNILVVIVIARTRSMHTTTNCYLLSLSVADSIVLLSATLPAIPETFFRVDEWIFGRVLCSLLIFLQYLGVDVSSLSITAFTIERYIAICHPMKAQRMCTVSRAKKIIAILWTFTFLYCSPWLGLTEIVQFQVVNDEPMVKCQFRLARSSYLMFYMFDLIVFYVIPLIIATVLYLLIGRILFLSRALTKSDQMSKRNIQKGSVVKRTDSRVQVVRMLIVVVFTFASLWMPYRVMVVYNSFAKNKFMDMWFLLFARTLIYVNCAINPVLYNIMSVKFKRAFRNHLSCWHRRFSTPSTNYSEVPTDLWASKRVTLNHHHHPQSKMPHDYATVDCGDNSLAPNNIDRRNSQIIHEKQQPEYDEINTNSMIRSSSQFGKSISFAEQAV